MSILAMRLSRSLQSSCHFIKSSHPNTPLKIRMQQQSNRKGRREKASRLIAAVAAQKPGKQFTGASKLTRIGNLHTYYASYVLIFFFFSLVMQPQCQNCTRTVSRPVGCTELITVCTITLLGAKTQVWVHYMVTKCGNSMVRLSHRHAVGAHMYMGCYVAQQHVESRTTLRRTFP